MSSCEQNVVLLFMSFANHFLPFILTFFTVYLLFLQFGLYFPANFLMKSDLISENETLAHPKGTRNVNTTQILRRTNLHKLRHRARYVASSCKEIQSIYGEQEGKHQA